jgi:hypothetical protein
MNQRLAWALAACCLSFAACSRGSPTTDGETASCVADTDCATGQVCTDGVCFDKPAVTCTKNSDCTGGATCNLLKGVCESTGTGTTGGSGASCTTKYDCPDGQACPSGKCVVPATTCRQDADCARGQICNFSQKCEAGCNPNEPRDCAAPKLCHPQKFVCEVCSQTNPCPKTATGQAQQCFSGTCRVATTCTTTQDCVSKGADGAVCKSGVCVNCTQLADCNVDPYKGDTATRTPGRICTQAGICQLVTCTDANCKSALGNLGYCDASTSTCQKYGCLSSSDCASTQECNVQQRVCVPKGGCVNAALSTCQSQCQSQQKVCNTATCTCSGTGGGGSCAQDADCGDTSKYACFSGTCNEKAKSLTGGDCGPLECLLGTFGVPLCTGAATGVACDATACLTGGLSGTGQSAPCVPSNGSGGGSCTPGTGAAGATCSKDGDCQSCKCNGSTPIPLPGVPSTGTCQ